MWSDLARHRGKALVLSVFALAATVFLAPTILGKKILSQADGLYFAPPWTACLPADLKRASNPLLGDQSLYVYPARQFAREQLRAGKVPLWNPAILMGTPFLGDMISAVFCPFNAFSYVGDLKRSFARSALIRLIVAGVGTYYLCRLLAVSVLGSILAGLSFMLCAFQVVWLNHPQTNVSVLLPWTFVAIDWIFTHRGSYAVLLLAGVVAGLLLGGHPETALHTALGAGVFFLYRVGRHLKEGKSAESLWSLGGKAIGGALLGVGLAALVVVPFVEFLGQSGIWEVRGQFARNPFVAPPVTVLTTIAPDLFGNPARGTDYHVFNYNERTAYAGLLPLLLALLALWRCRHDSRVWLLFGVGVFCLAIVLGLWPIFDLVTALPILHHTPNHRLLFLWQFCVAVLAGIAADHVMRSTPDRQEAVPKHFLMLAGVVSLVPFILWLVPQLGIVRQNPRTLYGALYPVVVGGLALGLFVLFRKGKCSAQVWGIAACALTFLDLYGFGHAYNPSIRKSRVFTCLPPSLQFLQSQEGIFRVAALEPFTLAPNTGMVYGLQDIRGYVVPTVERLNRFFTEGLQGYGNGAFYALKGITPPILRLLSLTNVRYLLSPHDLTNSGVDLRKIYSGEVHLYDNPGVLPRAFVVRRIQTAADGQRAFEQVSDPGVNLREVAIIESGEPLPPEMQTMLAPQQPVQQQPCADSVEITRYEPQRVHLQVDLCTPGVVVLTDTYYTGWKVYVDGVEQRMYRANYLFRGVPSAGGRHEIQFVYDPLSYKAGLAVSVGSALICLLIFARRRLRTESS